jgi:hypothetical protein
MKRSAALLALAFVGCLPYLSPALADCMCSANGTRYELGAVVCVNTSSGSWLGRCGKVLNNTSWKKLTDGCPLTQGTRDGGPPMSRPVVPGLPIRYG